ncbi:MAG TPA: phosphonoacetate hydrolase [Methylomirabilota bacterium]|nr:phosphonoacetate hydrolase [Methylomirabilota bacterium]
MDRTGIELNGVRYRWPSRPVVVVCIDGGDPAYFERGVRDGIVPNVARFMTDGFSAVADGDVPSFTCPNNMSITTGSPPSVHGISGNFYLDRDTGEAVVMTGPELLRSRTIMAEFSRHGARVASITAKDKLRRQLGKDMELGDGSVNFSAECADRCSREETGLDDALALTGLPLPDIYSPELSLFVLEAGIKLLAERRPDILYLSLTDYVQHKYAPGESEANRYYRNLDDKFGQLDALGAVVALTADHGMNDKSHADGSPRVIWLQDILDARFGKGAGTVICPITDRFIAHHGALGGFVRVYCHRRLDLAQVMGVARSLPGVEAVYDQATAARVFDLPLDREGDVVVVSQADTCIGAAEADHDLSGLKGHRLRSHGGVSERRVPFILNRPLRPEYAARATASRLRSYQIFDFALNGLDAT